MNSPLEITDTRATAAPRLLPAYLVLAIVLAALNLRPVMSSLAPVLPELVRDTGISSAVAAVLTMAPVLCLGLFGFLAPRLAAAFGAERTIVAALLVLAAGTALRGVAWYPGVLAGTIVAGGAIGIAGALLPSLIKRDFARSASMMMGVYTMALSIGAAGAAAATVPLSRVLEGWPAALAFWAPPAALAGLLWLPYARHGLSSGGGRRPAVRGLWRDPLAWCVTAYMGLQSALAFIMFGWLAPILRERGMDADAAGFVMAAVIVIQIGSALTAPPLASRRRSQSGAAALCTVMALAGFLGCLYAPLGSVWLWAGLLGLGLGGCFALALTLIVLRSPDAHVATHLSSMAQSVGYTVAAMGPLAAGFLRDSTGSWNAAGGLFVGIALLAVGAGLAAGRPKYVRTEGTAAGATL